MASLYGTICTLPQKLNLFPMVLVNTVKIFVINNDSDRFRNGRAFCSLDVGTECLKIICVHFGLFGRNVQTEILHRSETIIMIRTKKKFGKGSSQ